MPVSTLHPYYKDAAKKYWQVTRAIIHDTCRKLIMPTDLPAFYNYGTKEYRDACLRVKQYQEGGVLTPATKQTRDDAIGMLNYKQHNIALPKDLEYLIKDCTGTQVALDAFIDQCLSECQEVGRFGCLVDYPIIDGAIKTKAELNTLGVLPRFYPYAAENITNWATETKYGTEIVTMITLKEQVRKDNDDEFVNEYEDRYRILRLRKEGYTQEQRDKTDKVIVPEKPILAGNGEPFRYIPFFIFGPSRNGVYPNEPMLLQLAKINFAHLVNSCAHQYYVKLAGSGTLFFTSDKDSEQWKESNPEGIYLGAGAGYCLGTNGNASLLQCPDTNAHLTSMEHLEKQMKMVGAALIDDSVPDTTAYAIRSKNAAKVSPLYRAVDNIEAGVQFLFNAAAQFLKDVNVNDIEIQLNKEFIPDNADTALMQIELDGKADKITSKRLVQNNWKYKYGLIPEDQDLDELDKEIEAEAHVEVSLIPTNDNNNAAEDNNDQQSQTA